MKNLLVRKSTLTFLLLATLSTSLCADDEAATTSTTALGVRQERVARMMQDLEVRFRALARSLEEKEPERAAKLLKAFEESKRLLIERRMTETVALLDATKLDNAGESQQAVIKDLKALVALLLDEDLDEEEEREEIERLKKWREAIKKLIKEETQHENESGKLDKPEEAKEQIADNIAAIKALIKREQELIKQTDDVRLRGIDGLPALADAQNEIRDDTKKVLLSLANAHDEEALANSLIVVLGQIPLENAIDKEEAASESLELTKGRAAMTMEGEVVKELERALAELEKEQQRLEDLPPEAFDELANKQDGTTDKTNALGQDMAKAAKGGQGKGEGDTGEPPKEGEDKEDDEAAKTAAECQKCVGKAGQAMAQASGDLRKNEAGDAQQDQQDAIDELKKALDEVEERLEELGEDMQQDAIEKLQEIFTKMLERQKKTTAETIGLDKKKIENDGELKRADRVALRKVVAEEDALAAEGDRALEMLEEEGKSIVFPSVVANLVDNLDGVARLVEEKRTGNFTQELQHEIETTLQELIDALEQAKGGGSGGGGGGGGGGGKPPLLPNTAELKMLRSLQLRVNRRTAAFDKNRQDGKKLDKLMQGQIEKISDLQKEIADMVQEIVERQQ